MDALKLAKLIMGFAAEEDVSIEGKTFFHLKAQTWAAIAQAEQLKRMADAAERQATATEKRNELLIEQNATFARDVDKASVQRDMLLKALAVNEEE